MLLVLVIGIALVRGTGPATVGLLVGGAVSGFTSLGTVEPANHPNALVQLTMYLLVGAAFILLAALASNARRRRLLLPAGAGGPSAVPPRPVEPLSEREQEVLRLAASGISLDEVARRLFLSPNTVKTHLTHAYGKLGARGRSDAIRIALHFRYLRPDDICPHGGAQDDDSQERP